METIFEGVFYGEMCLKRNFRLQIGRKCRVTIRGEGVDAETFRPAVLKREEIWRVFESH